jgi:hypothetical protein
VYVDSADKCRIFLSLNAERPIAICHLIEFTEMREVLEQNQVSEAEIPEMKDSEAEISAQAELYYCLHCLEFTSRSFVCLYLPLPLSLSLSQLTPFLYLPNIHLPGCSVANSGS